MAVPATPAPATPAPVARPSKGRVLGTRPWVALVFLLPALILLGALVLYPILWSLVRSLYGIDDFTNFVGLGNYGSVFTTDATLTALKNNAIWVVVAPTVTTALGLVFAVLTERISWGTAFKLVIFMPMAISMLAAGIIFRLVYDQNPDKGVANAVAVGIHDTFSQAAAYPGARPRVNADLKASGGGSFTTTGTAAPGSAAALPLVGLPPASVASQAQAKPATPTGSAVTGTVWLDFKPGGGGRPGQVDPGEKALSGVRIEAVKDGRVVADATSAEDGTFTLPDSAAGARLRLPAANFSAPYGGIDWLGPTLVTPAIIGAYIWMWAGFAMVLIAAGLTAVPRELLEAARVDGAGEWQVFRRITVPLLAPVLIVVLVTLVINVLKVFDLVYIIAPGSTQQDANVLALQLYLSSFGGGGDQGVGSAIGIILLLLVLPAMLFNIRRFRRENHR